MSVTAALNNVVKSSLCSPELTLDTAGSRECLTTVSRDVT
jgi:hypothetical protein